jgi:hypothetical protein
MHQTRVNLRHLLEDLRDAYPCPIHEAVITELVANSLDSGAANIAIRVDYDPPRLSFTDDGAGMSRRELMRYHDIAATSKQRGQGIGFAGVGAKLSLLLTREVLTETRRAAFRGASRWWLETDTVAPWREEEPSGLVTASSGTGVCLILDALDSPLLDGDEIRRILLEHYEPLFDPDLSRFLFLYYPGGVRFEVNGKPLTAPTNGEQERAQCEIPGTRRRPLGAIRIEVSPEPLAEDRQGLAISVLGKVVKRGWEWIGLAPEHPELVSGVVELPSLVEILTTNKADFLRDAASLQRFYKTRKQVQEALGSLLADLGELPGRRPRARDLRSVEREMGRVLDRLLEGFPELEPLLERTRAWERVAALVANGGDVAGSEIGALRGQRQLELPGLVEEPGAEAESGSESAGGARELEDDPEGAARGRQDSVRRRRPGLHLAWVDDADRAAEMSWLEGSTLAINRAHPAFARARGPAAERLYLVLAVASALAHELEPDHDRLRFVSEFLARWGERERPAGGNRHASGGPQSPSPTDPATGPGRPTRQDQELGPT